MFGQWGRACRLCRLHLPKGPAHPSIYLSLCLRSLFLFLMDYEAAPEILKTYAVPALCSEDLQNKPADDSTSAAGAAADEKKAAAAPSKKRASSASSAATKRGRK